MAVQLKKTKPKKEKLAKAPKAPKAEKPAKITAVKIKKEKSIKVKREKPVKVTKDKTKKSSPKIEKTRSSVSIDGVNDKKTKAKTVKTIVAVIAIVVIAALLVVGVTMYRKYASEMEANGKMIASVYVSAPPTNTSYRIGDTRPDYSGLKIGILLKNGTNQYVEYTEENAHEFTFRGFDCSAYAEQQTITVTYKGYDCQFNISVEEKQAEVPRLSKISLETLPKTEYVKKEGKKLQLNTRGGVILLEYTNGSTNRVNLTNSNIDKLSWEIACDSGVGGPYEIIVFYVDWNTGIEKETSYFITITEETTESSAEE